MGLGLLALVLLAGPEGAAPDDVNARVLAFARSKLGEKVGDGECVALAAEALRAAGAKRPPDRSAWGIAIADLSAARPGDILQFEDATFRGRDANGRVIRTRWYRFPRHTAIVAKVAQVRGETLLAILHQNVGTPTQSEARKKVVQEWVINLAELREGNVRLFRPIGE